jgi:tetratricopeptide (TPR) repeat protein
MKRFFPFLGAGLLLFAAGCVTEKVHTIDLTGDIMIDAPRAIAEGPVKDRSLWEYRLAAAAMRRGDYATAKKNLDDALLTLGGIYGKDPNAKKARGYFNAEHEKTFIGEPYERVMAYYYRGILYWMDGEPDNARACFRTGELEDSSSEGDQYNADYVLLDYLDGLATTKLGDDGSDAFRQAEKLSTHFAKPPSYDKKANVLMFVEFGPGPHKYATGPYREELRFSVPQSPVHSAIVKCEGRTITVGPYDDLGFQATTRGGRVMDHVLANKAVFKTGTDVAGSFAIAGGAGAVMSGNRTGEEVGLGLIAAGLISKAVSAATTPAADTRAWDNLPRYLSFTALELPPGQHTVTVEFHDRFGGPMPQFTKTLNINVPADGHDKVVFVSDTSITPQNL